MLFEVNSKLLNGYFRHILGNRTCSNENGTILTSSLNVESDDYNFNFPHFESIKSLSAELMKIIKSGFEKKDLQKNISHDR